MENGIILRENGEITMTLDIFLEIFKSQAVKIGRDVSMALISSLSGNIYELEEMGEISSVADVLDYLDSLTAN